MVFRYGIPIALMVVLLRWALVVRGQDANYDQLNYHYVYPHLLLNGTLARAYPNLVFQSYFNPAVDLPWTWLVDHLRPKVATSVVVAVQAMNFVPVRSIARTALAEFGIGDTRIGRWRLPGLEVAASLAALLGVATASFLGEVGTSFSDSWTSLLVAAAFSVILRSADVPLKLLGAGVLLGAATGLKLTNAVYVIPAVLGVAWLSRGFRTCAQRLLMLVGGTVAGAAAVAGPWALHLWSAYGSPIFPLYNGVFRSPLVPARNFTDQQFRPAGVLDVLTLPVRMARGTAKVAEIGYQDLHWLLVVVLTLAWIGSRLHRGRALGRGPAGALIAMTFSAFVLWAWQFGYARYLIPVELLTGSVLAVLVALIIRSHSRLPAYLSVLSLVVLASLHPMDWSHTPFTKETWFGVDRSVLSQVPAGAVVLTDIDTGPHGYAGAYLPASVNFVPFSQNISLVVHPSLSPGDDYTRGVRLADDLRRSLHDWSAAGRPIFVLQGSQSSPASLRVFDLMSETPCAPVGGRIDGNLRLCPARVLGAP